MLSTNATGKQGFIPVGGRLSAGDKTGGRLSAGDKTGGRLSAGDKNKKTPPKRNKPLRRVV